MKTTIPEKLKKNSYLFFIYKLVIFLAIVFILDFGIGNLLRYYYFRQESGEQYRTTFAIDSVNADVLIFGSSRANHHYHPEIFESLLNMNFYNTGRDGSTLFYHYALLRGILNRYSPKIIILDLNRATFRKEQASYDRLSSLLPYYRRHNEIRPVLEMKSRFEKIKLISSIYPFNSMILTIAAGNMEFNKNRRSDNKGYVPVYRILNEEMVIENDSIEYPIDKNTITAFEYFIRDCLNARVKLIIVCSPYYIKYLFSDYSSSVAKEISDKAGVCFIDFSQDPDFLCCPDLFADKSHLNDKGARLFSEMLIKKIVK